jgi:hypothetical protein
VAQALSEQPARRPEPLAALPQVGPGAAAPGRPAPLQD